MKARLGIAAPRMMIEKTMTTNDCKKLTTVPLASTEIPDGQGAYERRDHKVGDPVGKLAFDRGGTYLQGVAIGAAVYGYVPASFVASVAGPGNPLAIPVAALVGIPLYVRAETMIPIAVALSGKGMGMGAVIALIIGGAGMSVPEMGMLASIFRFRLVAAFVAFVFLTAVGAGIVFTLIA